MSSARRDKHEVPSSSEQESPEISGTPVTHSEEEYELLRKRLEEAEQALADRQALLDDKEKLQAALVEKEALIKDIQHRVKNNLQVIISLINLQADTIADPVALNAIQKTRDRVMTVAFIYELLYRSNELNRLPFNNFLERMVDHLFYSYNSDPERVRITLQVEDVTLSINNAIPCGLILNELVSNSVKHAFPNNRAGSIWVELKKDDQQITLVVRDDGVGFPPGFNLAEANSLGLQLVKILTQQLQGKVNLLCDRGAEFQITFPAK